MLLLDFLNVFIFLLVGIFMVSVTLLLSRIVHPRNITDEKLTTYECGEDPVGHSWIRFNNRFYIFALIFVIFDVEAVFLFPWAVAFGKLGLFALVEMVIFILILFFGLFYAWRKGALKWV